VRSCRRGARLIWTVMRTEKKDIVAVWTGVVCNGAVFIVASPFSDGSRGFHQPDTCARSDLRRGNQEKHMHVWLLRTSRLFGQVAAFIGAAVNARAAARSRRNDRGIGHHSRAGVYSLTAPAFGRSTRRLRHHARLDRRPALIAIGAGRLAPSRRSGGCSTRRGTRGRVVSCGLIRAAV